MKRPTLSLRHVARIAVTLLAVIGALWAAGRLWYHYEDAPWTRDGRVKANVVQIAADVSGLVLNVHVTDNAFVHRGDPLFDIDPQRFELAREQARTTVLAADVDRAQAAREVKRNASLTDLVATETRELAQAKLAQAQARLAQARVALDVAELNLARSHILAPADGRITNLDLRTGAYATAGHPLMALVETCTFYVEGYFEETKLHAIHVGDTVDITPMGAPRSLTGRVQSIASGITDRDRSTGANLLPNVNPTFNWVRLAQRIPVRVDIIDLPEGVRLVAGQTATVAVRSGTADTVPAEKASADATRSAS